MPKVASKIESTTLSGSDLLTIDNHYLAGMPQLAYVGLSENWLLKECGHRHWMALAISNGKIDPEFHDDQGHKSYAAFTAVSVHSATLDHISENQRFSISTQLSRPSRARFCSSHQVIASDKNCVSVDMVSTFVFRRELGNNQSVTRASFAAIDSVVDEVLPEHAVKLMQLSKQFRTDDWQNHFGFKRNDKKVLQEAAFKPCPNHDFNGANFLYFASFQAFVDRAEWQWFNFKEIPQLKDRDLFYYGNINVGDSLTVRLCALMTNEESITHWCEVVRENGTKIADIFTHKRFKGASTNIDCLGETKRES